MKLETAPKGWLWQINGTSTCGEDMKSDILAYIPCAYLYGECHKYPLEMLACLHGCSSQATQKDLRHVPVAFSPPTCATKRPRACVTAPHSQKPHTVFKIFTFCMIKRMCCSAPRRRDPQFWARSSSGHLFTPEAAVFCHKLIFQSTPYILNFTRWI